MLYLCRRLEAQMAESVDALVSNTSGATRAGSTPALGTGFKAKVLQTDILQHFFHSSHFKRLKSFYITTAVPLVATMSMEPLAPMVS